MILAAALRVVGTEPPRRAAHGTNSFASSARQSPPVPGGAPVRTPGQAALKHKAQAEAGGLALYGDIMEVLLKHARELGVGGAPAPL